MAARAFGGTRPHSQSNSRPKATREDFSAGSTSSTHLRVGPSRNGRLATVLLVDDDALLCDTLRDFFERQHYRVLVAPTLRVARECCSQNSVDLVLLDERLPDGDGSDACSDFVQQQPGIKILFITAFPSFEHALRALRQGAHDYLTKPFELDHLAHMVKRLLQMAKLEHVDRVEMFKSEKGQQESVLVGSSPAMQEVRALIAQAAESSAPVLVVGETGTGKTLAARAIHLCSPRRSHTFVPICCASLPEHLVEAELFGWEKGAYTGAVQSREGLFEIANEGSVFLDEIGEMPILLQPKLLTVLDEGEVRRVGGVRTKRVDVRVIAATNVDLQQAIKSKAFRQDLFFRLNVVRLRLPPLREHLQDIPELCDHFLQSKCRRRTPPQLAHGETERLSNYNWPGNVRELCNALERSCIAEANELHPSRFLGIQYSDSRFETQQTSAQPAPDPAQQLPLAALEERHIRDVLAQCHGNRTRAADILGVSLSTLKRRLRNYVQT